MDKKKSLKKSFQLWKRANEIIPCGTQTLSKGPNMFTYGVFPIYIDHGQGAYVWDVDGNKYIDYPLALGPITLGYNYPSTVKAIRKQLSKGTTFTLMHPLEVEVAELLCDVIPCAEMVRFAKNGADVTTAAVKIARVVTGREHIAHCGYHGFHDWYIAGTEHNRGCLKILKNYIHTFKYNDMDSLNKIFNSYPNKIAAVIMEPVSFEKPKSDYLKFVRETAHQNGALFIFDEIVTGFRIALGGAQDYYNIIPDLATFGKGMANGMPLSAIVGRKEFMKEASKIFFSTTYGGECLSLASAKATISEMREKKVQDYLWSLGKHFMDSLKKILINYEINNFITVSGIPPAFWLNFMDKSGNEDNNLKGLFFQEIVKRGILIGGLQYISFSHTQSDIDYTLDAFEAACNISTQAIKENRIESYLEGTPPGNIFVKKK